MELGWAQVSRQTGPSVQHVKSGFIIVSKTQRSHRGSSGRLHEGHVLENAVQLSPRAAVWREMKSSVPLGVLHVIVEAVYPTLDFS